MNTRKFLNLTPHAIHLCDVVGQITATFPPSGQVARCAQTTQTEMPDLDGFPVVSPTTYGEVDLGFTLAELAELGNPHIIVSFLCLDGAAEQYDGRVVAPDTGPVSVRRDAQGQIIGVRRFVGAVSRKLRHAQALAMAAETPFFIDYTGNTMLVGLTAAKQAAARGHVVHQGYDSWRVYGDGSPDGGLPSRPLDPGAQPR